MMSFSIQPTNETRELLHLASLKSVVQLDMCRTPFWIRRAVLNSRSLHSFFSTLRLCVVQSRRNSV